MSSSSLSFHNLGIQLYKSFGAKRNKGSYFVERPYGNFFFFAQEEIEIKDPFIESKGGIYRQFDVELIFSSLSSHLFNRYGASLVSPWDVPASTPIHVEKNESDFFDASLRFHSGGIFLRQREKNIFFLSPQYFLEDDMIKKQNGEEIEGELTYFLNKKEIEIIFATSFVGSNHHTVW